MVTVKGALGEAESPRIYSSVDLGIGLVVCTVAVGAPPDQFQIIIVQRLTHDDGKVPRDGRPGVTVANTQTFFDVKPERGDHVQFCIGERIAITKTSTLVQLWRSVHTVVVGVAAQS